MRDACELYKKNALQLHHVFHVQGLQNDDLRSQLKTARDKLERARADIEENNLSAPVLPIKSF